jgi:hypothetical protein
MSRQLQIISLGAGVQSSCLALMAAAGEITPMPDAAIFADTQDEPASVYAWLDYLEPLLPFPVFRVSRGSLSANALKMRETKDGRKYSRTDIPFFTRDVEGVVGKIQSRGCTRDFKLFPIFRKCRELAGDAAIKEFYRIRRLNKKDDANPKAVHPVCQWIGISLDEVSRMKPSRVAWLSARWPLIDAEMSRHDCLRWMESRGYPKPPRSACRYCPYHSNAEWRRLRAEEPLEFEKAVQFEKAVMLAKAHSKNFNATPYLHRSAVPLDKVDFSTDDERGQGILAGFNAECEGMCGN